MDLDVTRGRARVKARRESIVRVLQKMYSSIRSWSCKEGCDPDGKVGVPEVAAPAKKRSG